MSKDFRKQLNAAYERKVIKPLEIATSKAILIAEAELTRMTPVGNPDLWKGSAPPGYTGGTAKSNWWTELGSPSTPDLENDNASAADAQAAAVAARYKVDQTAFISNNLPYIRRLDEGHSTQAPEGIIDAALLVTKIKVEEFIKSLKT